MTSLNNYFKFTLNIEADNLEFLDTSLGKYRGREAKFYHAVLHLDHCFVCCSNHIWHNGHSYSNVRYLALDASLPVFIRIAKERIISALTEDMSMKTIAIQNSVSTCTVQRMLEKYQTTSTQDYDWHLKDTLTQEQIVTDGLALSEELENTYNLLQDISKALINKNVFDLRKLLNCKDTIGYKMNITLKTFKRCLHDLLNAARFTESNGCLEGTNRKIKQIERTAYGYSNFYHLVTRIKLEEKDAILKEKR